MNITAMHNNNLRYTSYFLENENTAVLSYQFFPLYSYHTYRTAATIFSWASMGFLALFFKAVFRAVEQLRGSWHDILFKVTEHLHDQSYDPLRFIQQ